MAAVVLAAMATVLAIFGRTLLKERATAANLVALAVADGYRVVEPRLSFRFPHARFRMTSESTRIAALTRLEPDVVAEAGQLLGRPDGGMANLLLGRWSKALELFEQPGINASPIDRSAAYYMRGVANDSLSDFGRALEFLRIAGDAPEAMFNRALIFEQLSDRDGAAAEWQRYLSSDPTSEWAAEARLHLKANQRPSVATLWLKEKQALLAAAEAGQTEKVRELTTRYPLGSRRIVELEILPAWGAAVLRGETGAAARLLAAAQLIIAQRPVQDERLLETAIEELAAVRDPNETAALAAAYKTYGEGAVALEAARHDAALALFARALALAGPRSPTFDAIVAPAIITTHYRRYDHASAETLIAKTRQRYARQLGPFITLAARLDWLEGLIHIARGNPSAALRAYQRALVAYDRLGEAEYRAAQHVNQADSYTYLGDDERAGIHLRKALEYASLAEDPKRLHGILKVSADFLLDTGGPEAAVALQNRLVRLARGTSDPLRIADALVSRSPTLTRTGRRAEALRDVAAAIRLMPRIVDAPTRQRLQADATTAEAFAYRDTDDRRVVASLTPSIEAFRALQMRPFLAQLLLERGRAYTRLGNPMAAEQDFRAGIAELESQRGAVEDPDLRITYLDRSDRVFVDLAQLLLSRGSVEEAFDFLERSRARELLDHASGQPMQPMPVSDIRGRLREGTTVITHTLTGKTLLTFVVTRGGIRAFERPADPPRIAALVEDLRAGFHAPTGLPQPALRELGRLLVDGAQLRPGGRVIVIPDRAFHTVPFAALRAASGRYLIEEQTIAVAPSATLIARPARAADHAPSLLAMASAERPDGYEDLAALTNAPDEARSVASRYANSRILLGSDAEAQTLLSVSRAYDVLHFAGHSVVDPRVPARSALLVGTSGRISAAQIEAADLSHLRLVVLGGCNTGLGKSYRSEGVMSLARSFLVASVPEVVGTVSPIEDGDAKRLLTSFHYEYTRDGDAAEALRDAQLWMLHNGQSRDAEPARWSSYHVYRGSAERERR